MAIELEELVVADAAALRRWLEDAPGQGVWLALAKKGVTDPTSLSYAQAVDEALCSGWIDGQARRRDEFTYFVRFTPRRARSLWSRRNVEHVARLIDEGRMRPSGRSEVDRAKADGRWDAAYAGPATIEVPSDLAEALEREPAASEAFDALKSQDRYAILYRLHHITRPETRTKRLEEYLRALATDSEL